MQHSELISSFEYRWSSSRKFSRAKVLLISPDLLGQPLNHDLAGFINSEIRLTPDVLLCIECRVVFDGQAATRAFTTLATSRSVRAIRRGEQELSLYLHPDSWGDMLRLAPSVSLRDSVESLVTSLTQLRRWAIIDLKSEFDSSNGEGASGSKLMSSKLELETVNGPQAGIGLKEFTAQGKRFTLNSQYNSSRDILSVRIEAHEVGPRVQKVLALLQSGQSSEALTHVCELSQVMGGVSEIHFLQALVEIEAGKPRDAMRSLLIVLERNPDHAPARQALERLGAHIGNESS